MRSVLAFSVALNLLIVTSIVVARVDPNRAAHATPPTPSAGPVPAAAKGPTDGLEPASLQGYYGALRERGFSREETYLPLAGWVLRALTAGSGADAAYWRRAPGGPESMVRRAAREARLRQELLGIYGDAAARRPEFSRLFKPLGAGYESMTSGQQLAVVAAERHRRSEDVLESRGPSGRHGASTAFRCSRRAPSERPIVDLSDGLESSTRFEFALRTSPLAERLRALDLDEPDFRAAFAVLERFAVAATIGEQRAARLDLVRLLGDSRSGRLLRDVDPGYRQLSRLLADEGLSADRIDAAYAIVTDTQDAIIDVLGADGTGATIRDHADAERLAAISRTETVQLAGLVGADVAERIVSARRYPPAAADAAGPFDCSG